MVPVISGIGQHLQIDAGKRRQMLGHLARHAARARGAVNVAQVNVRQNIHATGSGIGAAPVVRLATPSSMVSTRCSQVPAKLARQRAVS